MTPIYHMFLKMSEARSSYNTKVYSHRIYTRSIIGHVENVYITTKVGSMRMSLNNVEDFGIFLCMFMHRSVTVKPMMLAEDTNV